MYLHTIVGYYNISSNFNFQVAGLKVKVTNYFNCTIHKPIDNVLF